MPISYVPQSVGKGATSGPFKQYQPKLAGYGTKHGAIIRGAITVGGFLQKWYKPVTGIAVVGIGAGLAGIDLNEEHNQFYQTLRQYGKLKYNSRQRKNYRDSRCCRPSKCC